MTYTVTETFKDYDGQTIWKGTAADELLARGPAKNGGQFWNLIKDGYVISVTIGRPPVTKGGDAHDPNYHPNVTRDS